MGNQTSQPVVKKTVRRVVKKRPPPVQQSIYSQPIPQQKPEVQTPQQFVQPPVREMNALMPRPQGTKSMGIMDVTTSAVEAAFEKYGVRQMIHGHTHRQNTHQHGDNVRYVLGDWEKTNSIMTVTESGISIVNNDI